MNIAYLGRIWQVRWNERSSIITLYQVVADEYGNTQTNKKIKTIDTSDDESMKITDGKSLLRVSLALVRHFSSKTSGPEFFIGVK